MSTDLPPEPPPPPLAKKKRVQIAGLRPRGRPPTGPTRNKGGRPTDFCRAVGERILKKVRLTAPLEDCAGSEGVTLQTVHNWMARGEKDHSDGKPTDFAWFFVELSKARSGGRLGLFTTAVKLARKKEDARLLLQLAERAAPELYVPPHRLRAPDPDHLPPAPTVSGTAPAVPRIVLPAELDDDDEPAGEPGAGDG